MLANVVSAQFEIVKKREKRGGGEKKSVVSGSGDRYPADVEPGVPLAERVSELPTCQIENPVST